MIRTGIFLFPDAELLDFCGPYEVFTAVNLSGERQLFDVFTFAETANPLRSVNGMQVIPDMDIDSVTPPDILVLPGGNGSRQVIDNSALLEQLHRLIEASTHSFSVCSGARILAKLGWLDGKKFTTHHLVFDDVQRLAPTARVRPNNRFTDNGKILTAAGVSAGIDLSLHMVEKLTGTGTARQTARYMEYPWEPQSGKSRHS
jgi:transcriptional regulator GlxA family with amidase domain